MRTVRRPYRIGLGVVAILFGSGLGWQWYGGGTPTAMAVPLGVLLLVVLYLLVVGRLLAGVLWRVLLTLVPLVVIATSIIWFLILPNDELKEVRTPLIVGTVIAMGWLVTFLVSEFQRASDRAQSQYDVLLALRSEIFAVVEKLDKDPIKQRAQTVQDLIKAGGNGNRTYHPFTASESPPIVYQAVSGSIPLLNVEALEPILRFYAAYSDLTAMVEDTRNEEFKSLSFERRIALHKDLVKNRIATLGWGLAAVKAANLALEVLNPEEIGRSGENPRVTAVEINSEGGA